MDKLSRTAKVLDKIIAVIFRILLIASAVCTIVLTVFLFLHARDPQRWSWTPTTLELGNVELFLHPDAIPANFGSYLTAVCVYLLVIALVNCIGLQTVRDILKPFIHRQPFHDTVARNLRKLAVLVTVYAALSIVGEAALNGIAVALFDPASLLRNDLVLDVVVNFTADVTPFLFAGALYLLSKVFQYGQELQTLSDETL